MDDIRKALSEKIQASGRMNEMTFKFQTADTDESRIQVTLEIMKTFSLIPEAKCKLKDAETSTQIRNEANGMFTSSKRNIDKLLKALELYSKSIATAPNESEELAFAHANRSALLQKFQKFEESLTDINTALTLDYPDHLKGKLLLRKIECLNSLNKIDEAKKIIEETSIWLEKVDLAESEKDKLKIKLDTCKNSNNSCEPPKKRNPKRIPKIVTTREIPCASEALTIKYNEIFGRYIIADRSIEPGEILVIEKPYGKILAPEERYTHCSHCLEVHWSLIPCKFCVDAMYCSEKCKNEAWEQYHDVECKITGFLLNLDFNKSNLLSLRLAILAVREAGSINELRNNLSKIEDSEDPCKRGFDEDGVYSNDKYISLYTLITNSEKRSNADLFVRASNSAFILYYLCTETNFFQKNGYDLQEMCEDEDILFIGSLILRHSQIISSNIHSVIEIKDYELVDIGAAALPFCSLINHSCDPNVSRCSTTDNIIIYALVPISKGSQIFDNYGSHYAVMNKEQRQQKLNQYYFQCECIACKKDWPTYTNLPSFHDTLHDKEKIQRADLALLKFRSYVDQASGENVEDDPNLLEYLSKMIINLLDCVSLPCHELNDVVETLKRVVALLYGNEFEIPKLATKFKDQ